VKLHVAGNPSQSPIVVQFEKIKDRHPEWSSANARCRVPVHARFWREWADQRVSRPEGPCVVTTKLKLHLYPKPLGLDINPKRFYFGGGTNSFGN